MLEKLKAKAATISKETVKEEVKKHYPEILQGATVVLLLYLAVKTNSKPVNVTVNINGGRYY